MTPTIDYDEQRRQRDDERYTRLVQAAQLADAELSVLALYDTERGALGHDFGNGQRFTELVRARRAQEAAVREAHTFGYGMGIGALNATRAQCLDAWERVSTRKLARYRTDPHTSATKSRAVEAWRRARLAIMEMDA
jgi:hypothetical protein